MSRLTYNRVGRFLTSVKEKPAQMADNREEGNGGISGGITKFLKNSSLCKRGNHENFTRVPSPTNALYCKTCIGLFGFHSFGRYGTICSIKNGHFPEKKAKM